MSRSPVHRKTLASSLEESFQNREFEVKKVLKLIAFCQLCVNMAEAKTDKAKVALITGITGQVRHS